MTDIKELVVVNVDLTTLSVKSEDFGLMLILGAHKVFNENVREYTELSDLLSDGFKQTSKEYLAAQAVFLQNPRVEKILIGRRTVDLVKIEITTVTANFDYKTTINGNEYVFNSGATPTAITIAAGLVAEIASDTDVDVTDNLDGTYVLEAKVAGTPYTLKTDIKQTETLDAPTDTITNDITRIFNDNSEWYGITELERVKADVIELATWCEVNKRLFVTVTTDQDIVDKDISTDTSSLPVLLKALNFSHTACFVRKTLDYIDCAFLCLGLSSQAGSMQWAFKNLIGFTADNWTDSQIRNAKEKQCNIYTFIAKNSVTDRGNVSDNKYIYIDIVRDIDWLIYDISSSIVLMILEADKIPMTDAGIAMIQGKLRERLTNAVYLGIFTPDNPPQISVPLAKNISQQDRIDRILRGVTFMAELANAILKVIIDGKVSP